MRTGLQLIEKERKEQIEAHKYTPDLDRQYKEGELIDAAVTYLLYGRRGVDENVLRDIYPWNELTFKPKDRIKNLQKAGALIAAELDRLQIQQYEK